MPKKADVIEQLTAIERVGPARAEKLYGAGIRSVMDVSLLEDDALAEILDTSVPIARTIRVRAEAMLDHDASASSTPGLLGSAPPPSGGAAMPSIPKLPPIPEPDPVIKVPHGAKMVMLAGPGRHGRGLGPLFGVLVCRECFVIKAMPNPRIAKKRERYGQMETGLVSSNLVCACKGRGSYCLQRDDRPSGLAEKIAGNPRNNVVFAQFVK